MGKLYMEKQLLQLVLFLNVGFSFITCQTSTSLPYTGENVTSLSISSTIATSLYSDVLSDSLVQTTPPVLQTSYDTYVLGTESSFQVTTGENSISQFNSDETHSTNLETKISSTMNNDLSSQSVYVSSMVSNIVSSSMTSSLPLVQTTTSVASVPSISTLSVTGSMFILDTIDPSSTNLSPSSRTVGPSSTISTSISSLLLEPEISGTSMEEASTVSESIFTTTQIQDTQSTINATPAFSSLTMMMSDMSPQSSFSTENITLPTESFVTSTNIIGINPTLSLFLSTTVPDPMSSSTSSILFSNDSSLNVIRPDFSSSLIDTISVFSSHSESSSIQSDISSPIYSSDSIFSDIGSSSAMILESSITQSIYHSSVISSDDLLTSSESSISFSNSVDFSSMSVSEYSDVMQSLTSTSMFVASSSVTNESHSDSFTATDSLVDGTTISPELETTSSLIDISFTTTSSDVVNMPSSMQSSFNPSTDSETVTVPSSMQSFSISSSSTEMVIEPSSMQTFPLSSSSVIVEGPQKHNSGGLTSGEKAAIGICIPIVIIVCLAGLIYYLYRRKYHVASWKLSDVVSYRPWSYSNASYYDDESTLIIPSL